MTSATAGKNRWPARLRRALIRRVRRFWADEGGPTAVEYAVMLALILIVLLGAVNTLGTQASGKFKSVASSLDDDD